MPEAYLSLPKKEQAQILRAQAVNFYFDCDSVFPPKTAEGI